ncbi:MAG: phenylalanine-4-hydroxylase [Flavobacteriales bacterium]|jgi:phenylalanine-4-hydroxylase|nr:phenylalanine-4-hydroxylase [Flavobacteriales bacterium]
MMIQDMEAYTSEDKTVWKTLFNRQVKNLKDKVSEEYELALNELSPVLNAESIPCIAAINEWFKQSTGWEIVIVPGLIPVEEFFQLLAEKKFCSSTWLRTMEQLDYLEEPDMFHDIFGHVPLLSNPVFSEFMQKFGKIGCSVIDDKEKVTELQRLYWFTIEFGMINQHNPTIYGAGIISSYGESNRCVRPDIEKIPFKIHEVLKKSFHTDEVQDEYICIDSFEELFASLEGIEAVL